MSDESFIVAIDGPAASGKGTLARNIAESLNFAHLDTGALYRAVAYEVIVSAGDPMNKDDALKAAQNLTNKLSSGTPDILSHAGLREDTVANAASKVATIPAVREALIQLQRGFASNPPDGKKGAVLDGRDIGTVICPDATIKLFITADTETRAKRRLKELQSRGIPATYEAVLTDMRERDARDQGRKTAPLVPADDALIIDTSHLTAEEALNEALGLIRARLP